MKTKAAVLYQMNLPAPYSESTPLQVEEVHLEAPGAGEVLIEIVAAGLCHSDLSVIDGSRPRVMPMVMGHEAAGIVRETGKNVTGLTAGDHVVFSFAPSCGEERTIKGSCMGSAVSSRDIPRFIGMYQAGLLPVDQLLTHTLQLDDINAGFDRLTKAEAVRQIITF